MWLGQKFPENLNFPCGVLQMIARRMHSIMGQAYVLQCKCCGGNIVSHCNQERQHTYTMTSCHCSTIDASAKCKNVIAMPAHKSNCTLAVLQLAPLKTVSTQMWHPYARYACTQGQFAPYCRASEPAPWKFVLKLQRISSTTVAVAGIPDFAAFIIDGRLGWTPAVVSFNIMIIWSAPLRKFERWRVAAIFAPSTRCAWCGRVQINVAPGTPVRTIHHSTQHHTTR